LKTLWQTTRFAKDVKRMRHRGCDLAKLETIVRKLACGETLEPRHRDHPLRGSWKHSRDCHIEPDWILIYTTDAVSLRLERTRLERTGTHSDLFE
jgi:mRNA interferase YafQ